MIHRCWFSLFFFLSLAPGTPGRAADPSWLVRGQNGVVASDSALASQAGLDMLRAGGNAIDAAVAVSFTLAVTRPYSTGLGGGGFMIARLADGRVVVQDFRETAPAGAKPDMYIKRAGHDPQQPSPSRIGHLAVAVPGLVAGRCQALARHGTLPLSKVMAPAIHWAREGFPVDRHYVDTLRGVLATYKKYPSLTETSRYVYQTHLAGGRLRAVGDKLQQPHLARLLEGIALHGPDFFYQGPVAKAIALEMKRHGGIIQESDLAAYKVRQRKPIRATYRKYELISMPPPSSGGVALAQSLNLLEVVRFSSMVQSDRGKAIHYQIEAMKHAFADRARWLGDSDFADVPVGLLTSKVYAEQLAATLNPDRCTEPDAYGSTKVPDDSGTSHFCVVDRWGNAVVSTETINTSFGSLTAVAEWGLILNNEMDDFTAQPGQPNAYGLMQSKRNAIAPGKRPLSSMTPTIVLQDGKPYLMLGASGGPRIISSVFNVLLGITDFGLSLEQAMVNLRPHHQWLPNQVYFNTDPSEAVKQALTSRGHQLANKKKTGIVQAILRTKNGWEGASDPRKGGRPAGY